MRGRGGFSFIDAEKDFDYEHPSGDLAQGGNCVKVLAINGSPRKKGNTQIMIDAAVEELRHDRIDVETIAVTDYDIRPCTGCDVCSKKPWTCPIADAAIPVLKKMVASDGIILGSPVYCGGVTAQLKALLDRSVIPYQKAELKDKVGGALTVGGAKNGGQELTLMQMNAFFLMHDMVVASSEGGNYGGMATGNDRGDVRVDEEGMKKAKAVGTRMAHLLKR
jgi:multimeric flavodoxin WrbA